MSSITTLPDKIVPFPEYVDPSDQPQVGLNWTAKLSSLDRTIATSTWTATGLTFDNDDIVTGNLKTTCRLSGFAVGGDYTVSNKIVTTGTPALTYERSFTVHCEQR